MSIVTFTWKRSDNTDVSAKLHVDDLTGPAGHAGRGDMFIYHVMPLEHVPVNEQWEAIAEADADPIRFWSQVHSKNPKWNLPAQLYDGKDTTWIDAFKQWAQNDLNNLKAGGGDLKPVCRITAVSVVKNQVTVKTATVNH